MSNSPPLIPQQTLYKVPFQQRQIPAPEYINGHRVNPYLPKEKCGEGLFPEEMEMFKRENYGISGEDLSGNPSSDTFTYSYGAGSSGYLAIPGLNGM